MDRNGCELDFLDLSVDARSSHLETLYKAVTYKPVKVNGNSTRIEFSESELEVMYGLLHNQVKEFLNESERNKLSYGLQYWNIRSEEQVVVSPVSFDRVANAVFSSQVSSASAERLFSDLGRIEGRERQSLLRSSLEMINAIFIFVVGQLRASTDQ